MRKFFFFFLLILIVACSRHTAPVEEIPDRFDAKLDHPFELRVNQTGHIPLEMLDLTLLDVRDTRCPTAVECKKQGYVEIDFKLSVGGAGLGVITIVKRDENNFESESLEGYTITVAGVSPYPQTEEPISLSQYKVKTIITELVA